MMIRKLLPCLAVLILAGMVFQPTVWADDTTPAKNAEKPATQPEKNNPMSWEDIRHALTKKIDWDFNETPLSDVVEVLKKDLKIPVRLDLKAINDLGVTPESPVTFKLSGITAKTALKHLLKDLGLTMTCDNEVMLITSPDWADVNLKTVIYNVAEMPTYRRANGTTVPDFDQLIDTITRTIKPTTWDSVGGPGSVMPYDAGNVQVLVISQTWEVHEEISDLLGSLRKFSPASLSKEEIEKLPLDAEQKPKQAAAPRGMEGYGGGMGGYGGGMMGSPSGQGQRKPAAGTPAVPNQTPSGTPVPQ
jgi:hypothetical protein